MLARVCWAVLLVMGVRVAKAQSGFQTFNYPGTNFHTELTAINDNGQAVGWFKVPAQDASCDPAAFGGPCKFDGGEPYGFVYQQGKFQRLRGPLVEVANNRPIAINNRGQVLILHGLYTFIGPTQYLVYDIATGKTQKLDMQGRPAKGAGALYMGSLMRVFGMNREGVVVGFGQVIEKQADSGIKQKYGLMIGIPNGQAAEESTDSGTSGFKEFEFSFAACPKSQFNEEYGRILLAGPNDSGQVAASCGKEAAVYDSKSGRATALFALPGDQPNIEVHGISNDGTVVGCSAAGSDPFIFRSEKASPFPLPEKDGCALGVNAKGQIVGVVGDKAFIYMP